MLQRVSHSLNSWGTHATQSLSGLASWLLEATTLLGRGEARGLPRILLLADRPGWAFDHSAKEIAFRLRKKYRVKIAYIEKGTRIFAERYDLVYIFFWGETRHDSLLFAPDRIIKQISSHRWEDDPRFGPCDPSGVVAKYLRASGFVSCTSARLFGLFQGEHPRVRHVRNGYNPERFFQTRKRDGAMCVGWAGNSGDAVKGLDEIIRPGCGDRFALREAPGNLTHKQMNAFYNELDIFIVGSRHEGEPLTLIEAMAAGCFPVCTNVGIVPELIQNGVNGVVLDERTPGALRKALEWCESNLVFVREAGRLNSGKVFRERRWEVVLSSFSDLFDEALAEAQRPKFRNDDVSFDTNLDLFKRFCELFWSRGFRQVHGVTLFGRTSCVYDWEGEPVEYPGRRNLSYLPYEEIRSLSKELSLEGKPELIEFLAASPDELALHGLYHSDYSLMSRDQQKEDLIEGLRLLSVLFPRKVVRYFIPPFNRVNSDTHAVCRDLGLHVLGTDSIHFEEKLGSVVIRPNTWYRYHHHRFYPETRFKHWSLSIADLENALDRHDAS